MFHLFVKRGVIRASAIQPCSRCTGNFIQKRRIITIDADGIPGPENETKRVLINEGLAKSTFSLENHVFRLEDNFVNVTKDIGDIKRDLAEMRGEMRGEIGTINWQLKILLGLCLTGSGSLLLYLLKGALDKVMVEHDSPEPKTK